MRIFARIGKGPFARFPAIRSFSVNLWIIDIPAPFPDVSMHSEKAPGMRFVAFVHTMGVVAGVLAIPGNSRERSFVVPIIKVSRSSSPAGVFTFCFGRQPHRGDLFRQRLPLRQPIAKVIGIVPGYRIDRMARTFETTWIL